MKSEAAAQSLRTKVEIRRIEVIPIRVTLSFKRTLSKGGVSLGKVGSGVGAPVLIRVESGDGAVGYGQVRPPTPWLGETTDGIVSAIRDYYAPALIKSDVTEREMLGRRLDAVLPGNTVAQAGLEMAILDLLGKTLGIPVYSLLGGSRREIPLDWSISLNPIDKMVEEALKGVQKYGVRIMCLKAGPSSRWEQDIEVFHAVRAAVGPDVEIGIDPNEGYDLPTAIKVLRALESERVAYVEQALPRQDLEGFRVLRGRAGVPILLDESAITLADAHRAVHASACDGLVLKIWKSGGIMGACRMATIAEAGGVGVTVGGVAHGSILEAAACAHLYSSLHAPALAAEFALGLNVVDQDPVAQQPEGFFLVDGRTTVPGGPGLGVEIDMAAVEEIALSRHSIE